MELGRPASGNERRSWSRRWYDSEQRGALAPAFRAEEQEGGVAVYWEGKARERPGARDWELRLEQVQLEKPVGS